MPISRTAGRRLIVGGTVGLLAASAAVVPLSATAQNAVEPAFDLTIDTAGARPGDAVTATVSASDLSSLYAYDLVVAYDAERLAYVDDATAVAGDGAVTVTPGDGIVRILYTEYGTSSGASGGLDLASLRFIALRSGSAALAVPSLTTVTDDNDTASATDVASESVEIAKSDAPFAVDAPVVTGSGVVGSRLTATTGTWSEDELDYTFQWLRGETVIDGATAPVYEVTPADADSVLTAVVSAIGDDTELGSATSNGVETIDAATKLKAHKNKSEVKRGKKVQISAEVTARGIVPTGTVEVLTSKGVKSKALTDGDVKMMVTLGGHGKHKITVRFVPDAGFEKSKDTLTVRVVK